MMITLIVFVSCLLAGVIQSVTGFGAAIIAMLILPYALSITSSTAVIGAVAIVLNVMMVIRYRKSILLKEIIGPAIICFICSSLAIVVSKYLPVQTMKLVFSIFLILLACYFIFFSNAKIQANFLSMLICSAVSGFGTGFFGIGGPTMVLYYLALTKNKQEYLGTIQAYFMLTSIYSSVVRIASGILTSDLYVSVLIGAIAIGLGQVIGSKIVDKIPTEKMKKCIYYFLAFAGVVELIQCF